MLQDKLAELRDFVEVEMTKAAHNHTFGTASPH